MFECNNFCRLPGLSDLFQLDSGCAARLPELFSSGPSACVCRYGSAAVSILRPYMFASIAKPPMTFTEADQGGCDY